MLFEDQDLSTEALEMYSELLEAPLADLEDLIERLIEFREHLAGDLAQTAEFVDDDLAQTIAARALELLERVAADYSTQAHKMAQAVVLYFIGEEDSDDDLGSPVGFDDDRDIFNAVAAELDHHDLVIGY